MKRKIEIHAVFAQPIEKEFKDTDIVCEHCRGLGFIPENLLIGEIETCKKCNGTGIGAYLGECGKMHKTVSTPCGDCFNIKTAKKEKEQYDKAKKIKAADYKGYVVGMHDYIEDIEDFLEDYRDNFDEDYPEWVFGARVDYKLGFDLIDSIGNEINDCGYEDMIQDVNMDSEKLEKAQKLIDEWIEEEKSNTSYCEDTSVVVDLSDVYNECLEELRKEDEHETESNNTRD